VTGTVAITDEGWYRFLYEHPELREVNFWRPSARASFNAPEFSPFFFKLRALHNNAICGFAFFAHFSRLPDWLAWDLFEIGNGCPSFEELHTRIADLRAGIRYNEATGSEDIGCIELVSPVFFAPDAWIPGPSDWHPRTQVPMAYDLTDGEGKRIWEACMSRLSTLPTSGPEFPLSAVVSPIARYGDPRPVRARLGQATFRSSVLDAYGRACAVTSEHSLPALEASHIRPFAEDGPHEVSNGLLLRADLHRLFDTGYVTVTPDLRLEVSRLLRDQYHNGRSYYPLDGTTLRPPEVVRYRPDPELLRWHNNNKFRR